MEVERDLVAQFPSVPMEQIRSVLEGLLAHYDGAQIRESFPYSSTSRPGRNCESTRRRIRFSNRERSLRRQGLRCRHFCMACTHSLLLGQCQLPSNRNGPTGGCNVRLTMMSRRGCSGRRRQARACRGDRWCR